MTQSPSTTPPLAHNSSSPTTLLDVADDVYGLIYDHLKGDRRTRAAFRRCCKAMYWSPSINTRLQTLVLRDCVGIPARRRSGSNYSTFMVPESIMEAIACYPKPAVIRQVDLSSYATYNVDVGQFLEYLAESSDPVTAAARARVRTIKAMDVQDIDCGATEASRVLKLFPELEILELWRCSFSNEFFYTLAAHRHSIHMLFLSNTKSTDGLEHALEGVAQMTGVHGLELHNVEDGTNLTPLASLQNLRHLSVAFCDFPVGFGHVVSSVPLTSLHCDYLQLPHGERLSSGTLTTLSTGCLTHQSHSWICALDCPCLNFLHFTSYSGIAVNNCPESEEVLDQAESVARVAASPDLTWTGNTSYFYFSSTYPDSTAFHAALIKRLFVMAHKLAGFRGVRFESSKLDHAILRDVATLFPNVTHLTLRRPGLHNQLGLPDLLTHLPHLDSIKIWDFGWDVREAVMRAVRFQDLFALLHAAKKMHRQFFLCIESNSSDQDRWFMDLEEVWEDEVSRHPPQVPVRLVTEKLSDKWIEFMC